MKPIYLDYAATTPLDQRVVKKMQAFLSAADGFGNASSLHAYGVKARDAVEVARAEVAALLQAECSEIIFTSGATESNNLAIKGVAHLYQQKGKHLVTMKTEHTSVLDTCQHLEKSGFAVTYLAPKADGLVDLEQLQAALRADTCLVSIMHVNNETGVIQPIEKIAALTSERGILLHVDAAQSVGKISLDVTTVPIDLVSLSAHKVYGPKGIGALYLRKKPRVRVMPLIHGGGHEQGMRSGTLPVHQIVGMGIAYAIAATDMQHDTAKITTLRQRFLQQLQTHYALQINGHAQATVPHILNLSFTGMLAQAILQQVPGIATSSASACLGGGSEGSYVLRAMGYTTEQAKSAIRFSFGRMTTVDAVDRAAAMMIGLKQI